MVTFDGKFDFESFFSTRGYTVPVSGKSDFPNISTLPKNIYWTTKKVRPPQPPESYISKAFVQSENVFEFGPLLIGKNPNNRQDPAIKNINSTTFRISNQGKFDCELEFALMSSVITDNPEYKSGVFCFEPENLVVKSNDITS